MSRQVIVGLDFVRFGAALLVVLHHLAFGSPSYSYPEIAALGATGWIGVEIFFVLSGFVICYTANGTAGSFARSRFLRLMPAMLICASITATVWLAQGTAPADVALRWLKSVSFLPFYDTLDGIYWTLPVEVAFYALVWLLLATGKRGRLEGLLIGVGFLTFVYYGLRMARKIVGESPDVPIFSWLVTAAEYSLLFKFGCFFALGGLLYLMLIERFGPRRLAFALFFLLLGMLFIYDSTPGSSHGVGPRWLPLAIWLAALVAIIASVRWNALLARIFSARVTRAMGLATYPFYLLHQRVGHAFMAELLALGVPRWPALLLGIAAMAALALFVALVAEPPLQRRLRALITRSPSPAPRAATELP